MIDAYVINWAEHTGSFAIAYTPDSDVFFKNGSFDIDAWEAAHTWLSPGPGTNLRQAWKTVWGILRSIARGRGGMDWLCNCTDITDPNRSPLWRAA